MLSIMALVLLRGYERIGIVKKNNFIFLDHMTITNDF